MLSLNQKRIISYYSLGAASLLLIFKIYFSSSFSSFVDYFIVFVSCVVVIAMTIRGVVNYHKDHDNLKKVVHNMLINTLVLLVITLITYILYSPRIMAPLVKLVRNLREYISLENYFLLALYVCLFTVAVAVVNLIIKTYMRARGSYSGSIRKLAKDTLYTVFFIFAVLFSLSIAAYSEAYGPITEFASRAIYNTFLDESGTSTDYNASTRGVSSLKEAVNETIKNITENVSNSQEKLVTNITETKDTLTEAIGGTSDELKSDIDAKLNVKGGKLKGDLTVNGTLYAEDIIPASNSTYDLGSSSKAWNALYVQSIDYAGGVISLESNKIENLADPTSNQDAATKSYVDAQISASPQVFTRSGTTLSPTTSGDSLNMANAVISNIGNAGTDFTASGGLNLAGVLTAASASAHTLGSVTITGGAIAGVTNLNMSGALDLGTNTINDGDFNGNWDFNDGDVTGINDLTITGNLTIPDSTSSIGVIYSGTDYFIHTTGTANTFVGENAGRYIGDATYNTGIGESALQNNYWGDNNIAVGYRALYQTSGISHDPGMANYNIGIGNRSLYGNAQGSYNIAIGYTALYNKTSDDDNIAIGHESQYTASSGGKNVSIGNYSHRAGGGSDNTALGYGSLYSTTGSYNTSLGFQSGYSNTSGSFNVFLGFQAGYSETGSNKLYIDSSNTSSPLVYGDFSANALTINGSLSMANNKISNVTDPTSNQDAATKNYVDSLSSLADLTLSGNLTLPATTSTTGIIYAGSNRFIHGYGSTTNAFIGTNSGNLTMTGVFNTAVGGNSLDANTSGHDNVSMGYDSLGANLGGNNNVGVGNFALGGNQSGSYNVALGYLAGGSLASGSSNVFLGSYAGMLESGSSKLYIESGVDDISTPLIYGDFSGDIVNINGKLGVGDSSPDTTMKVVGSLCVKSDGNNCAGSSAGTIYANNTTVQSADYAEYFFTPDTDLESGEAVCIDTSSKNSVKRCSRQADSNIMGIVSTNPAIVGNTKNEYVNNKNYKIIGMLGQVPGKVTNENGNISSGDELSSASKSGYLKKASPGDSTVGIALESTNKPTDTINVLISRKNKSLTVEQVEAETEKRIARMDIEDEVNSLISNQLKNVETDTGRLKADLENLTDQIQEYDDMMAAIQDQMEEIKDLTDNEVVLAQIDLNKNDIDFIKLTLGTDRVKNPEDVDILGQLSAKEISAGVYSVTNDKDAPAIGTATIKKGETEVTVKTEAVGGKSRVFVTPIAKNPIIWSVSGKEKGESFTIKIKEEAEDDLEFDWWIIKEE